MTPNIHSSPLGMTKRQTTANHHKPPKITQITANHRKPPQITTRIWDDRQWNQRDAGKPPQTTANHWKPPPEFGMMVIRVLVKASILSKLWLVQSSQAVLVEHNAFANTHHSKSCIFTTFQWWFVVI